jgi:hypothetical protein
MLLKAIALVISSALLVFMGLVLLGANSMRRAEPEPPAIRNVQLTAQAEPRPATTECVDLPPLLDQLLARSNQPVIELEE